eukprot:1006925-Pleurochrysis_carterae.AAC.1
MRAAAVRTQTRIGGRRVRAAACTHTRCAQPWTRRPGGRRVRATARMKARCAVLCMRRLD